jgi:hypothetical protein
MEQALIEEPNEKAPLNPPQNSAINSSVAAAGKTLGTPTFLM